MADKPSSHNLPPKSLRALAIWLSLTPLILLYHWMCRKLFGIGDSDFVWQLLLVTAFVVPNIVYGVLPILVKAWQRLQA